jgi:hypothetical protein
VRCSGNMRPNGVFEAQANAVRSAPTSLSSEHHRCD